MATLLVAFAIVPATANARFQIGLQDVTLNGGGTVAYADQGYRATEILGAAVVRVNVSWAEVAGPTPFALSNPSDPHYRLYFIDNAIRRAAAHHLQTLLMIYNAPTWAEGPGIPPATDLNVGSGAWEPNPILFGEFVHALAERYSGSFPDPRFPGRALPRVSDYQLWNEPSLGGYLAGPDVAGQFRNLVNAGYGAIKSVHSNNLAVLGGLAPISPPGLYEQHPLSFIRQVFCLRQVRSHYARIKRCPTTHFDVAAVHPYTLAATPTKPANDPNDILVHDVYKLRNVVKAAEKLHTVNRGSHRLWNTEWAWFTNPPQAAYGDPDPVAARYVAYSMYEMWKAGLSLVVWQTLADVTRGANPGGGLETSAGAPKLMMTAFGFPFIASVGRHHKGYGWGRAPVRSHVTVFVQHLVKGTWRQVAKARTDGYGVFQVHFKAAGNGTYRAQVAGGGSSVPYFSARIPARRTHPYTFG